MRMPPSPVMGQSRSEKVNAAGTLIIEGLVEQRLFDIRFHRGACAKDSGF